MSNDVHDLAVIAWLGMIAAGDHRASGDDTVARRAYQMADAFAEEATRRRLGRTGPNKEDESEART